MNLVPSSLCFWFSGSQVLTAELVGVEWMHATYRGTVRAVFFSSMDFCFATYPSHLQTQADITGLARARVVLIASQAGEPVVRSRTMIRSTLLQFL